MVGDMEKYKVCTNNFIDSNSAQELLISGGYRRKYNNFTLHNGWVCFDSDNNILCVCSSQAGKELNDYKEITLPELRDMVVLKRNDESDASHVNENTGEFYRIINGTWHVLNEKWELSSRGELWILGKTKPIKKEVMKEYLVEIDSWNYRYTGNVIDVSGRAVIEIPDGAEILTVILGDNVFYKSGNPWRWFDKESEKWMECSDIVGLDGFQNVLWKREKESIIDKLVVGEVKHSHYKKDVSHLNVIDPYRIADLYALHPCAEHIMKKSLCAGNRGHKDTLRDIQDIIDTAERWKQMIEEDNNEI